MSLFTKFSSLIYGGAVGSQSTGARFYDALKDTGSRRRNPTPRIRASDNKLRDRDRRGMSAKTSDLVDNFTILAWMVTQHVNYITGMEFKANTGKSSLDRRLEEFMDEWSVRMNCHTQQKHNFNKLIRHIERQRVVDGDVFVMKVAGRTNRRGSIQLIEADRIANPVDRQSRLNYEPATGGRSESKSGISGFDGYDQFDWANGVRLNRNGTVRSYALHRRSADGSLEFEREVLGPNMVHHGTFDRPDQVRGISPLSTSLNTLEDIYEGFRLTLGKIKVSQVLGAFISRQSDMSLGALPTEDSDNDGLNDSKYEYEFDDGINIFDLNDNESVQVVQDNSTSSQTTEFLRLMIQVALKSLDIPYSFYSEDFTNWYGARGAVIQYKRSCKHKQEELITTLNEIVQWAMTIAAIDGKLDLPKSVKIEDLKWLWVPNALPWWDPQKEVAGHKSAIEAGFTSYQRVCRENGVDFEEVMRERKEAEELAEELGVTLVTANSTSVGSTVNHVPGDDSVEEEEAVSEEAVDDSEEDSQQQEEEPDNGREEE